MFLTPSRVLARICLAGATLGFAGLAALAAVPASASASASAPSGANPYLPSNGHPYRHGAIPTRAQQGKINSWNAQHGSPQKSGAATGPDTMYFYGGLSGGAGAVTSTPRIYLVFWGNQWGTQGTDSNGNLTFTADSANGAPYIQQLLKGLGTNNELWSGTMTQYCDGSLVALLASSCPSGAPHVGYPSGNALVNAWYDNAAAAPSAASYSQIASEAAAAAHHFGNTTSSSNRYAQYVVLSAPGTDPDNYLTSGFCAWHDWTSSNYGSLAFTNMPYVMDVGYSCGAGFVNSGGTLDGYSIVEGHEYAETLTDEFPSDGWLSSSGSEVGDECAWIRPGNPGGAANVAMATGSFAMQSTWSNDTNSCAISHAVVTGSNPNTVTVTNPTTNQTSTAGTGVSLQATATDSAPGATLTFSASGLPAGLSISSSGLISGTLTNPSTYSVTVTATDTTGANGSASFSWTVNPSGNKVTVTSPTNNQTTTAGTAVSLQVNATDSGSSTLTYSATGLPPGLSIGSITGLISGTPTTATTTTYSVTVTATDTTGSYGSASFSWTVNPSGDTVTVTNPGSQTTTVGTLVSLHITATDSPSGPTLTYSASGLPAGLSINPSSGVISGKPSTVNTYSVTVTATDSTGSKGSTKFSWTITRKHH